MTAVGEQTTTGAGEEMHALVERLYPLCRSITGDGVRATLEIVGEYVPLQVHEVPTGTQVLDWTVPQEWNIRDAYVADSSGRRVVDFAASSLHVLGYSVPVSRTMPLAELREHLHTLPDHPAWVPYRTSYYKPEWGFCLAQETLDAMPDGDYEVRVDSTLADGHLTYAEHVVPGQVQDEVIVSCHVCHPSLANDNLAGIAVATFLARALAQQTPYYTYRFIYAPGTIGAITWLARNAEAGGTGQARARAGLRRRPGPTDVQAEQARRRGDRPGDAACAGRLRTPAPRQRVHSVRLRRAAVLLTRVRSRRGLAQPDPVRRLPRVPHLGGQPGLRLPGRDGGHARRLPRGVRRPRRQPAVRQPQPLRRTAAGPTGLYDSLGGRSDAKQAEMAMLWVLSLSDGEHGLLDVAERSGLPFGTVAAAADALHGAGLIKA